MNTINYLYELLERKDSAILLHSPPNLRYYLGQYFPKNSFLIIIHKEITLFTDDCSIHAISGVSIQEISAMHKYITRKKIFSLSTTGSINLKLYNSLCQTLPCKIVADNKLERAIYTRRSVKSTEEIEKITEAQRITDAVFTESLNYIKAGLTDIEIQRIVGLLFYEIGSQMLSYNHVLGCGIDTSLPHVRPTGRTVVSGDFVMMDIGAQVDGYGSDMTRMVGIGAVNDEKKMMYSLVLKAQETAIACTKCGTVCRDVDAAARNVITDAGYGQYFLHGLGHPIGLGGHEGPRFNQDDKSILTSGLVMTIEPGIYLPQKFGVRIEDMIYILDDQIINLTKSTKKLICL